jgi:phage-related protein
MPEIKAASDALSTAFSGLQKWFGNVASAVMEELGPALMELWDAFKEVAVALEPVFEALGEIWAAFTEGEGSGNILKDILGIVAESIKTIAFVLREMAPYIKLIAGAFKEAADILVPIIETLMKVIGGFISWLRDSFQGFYNWLVGKSLWQEMWGAVVSVTTQMAGQILSGLSKGLLEPMRNAISSTLQTIKNMWDSAMRGLADSAKGLWNLLTGHSIWTDMLSQMVAQTQDAMSAIQGEFGQGLTGPTGIVPTMEAAQPRLGGALGGSGSAAVAAQAITLPIYVYLDGQQIQTILERRLVETINRDASRSRRA